MLLCKYLVLRKSFFLFEKDIVSLLFQQKNCLHSSITEPLVFKGRLQRGVNKPDLLNENSGPKQVY